MKIYTLQQEQLLPISPEAAWRFFSSPNNLNEITPPDVGFKTTNDPGEKIYEGLIITYRIKIAPGLWMPWVTEIRGVDEGRSFIDEQRFGPYKFWHHRHTFEAVPGGTLMRDFVHYGLSFGPLGMIAHGVFVGAKLKSIFDFRKQALTRKFGSL